MKHTKEIFEESHTLLIKQAKEISQKRAYLNFKEFVRVAGLKDVFDIDAGLMNIHTYSVQFVGMIDFENDYFRFSYENTGTYEDINERLYSTYQLRCQVKDAFDFQYSSIGHLCIRHKNEQIDNVDDDEKIRQGDAQGNFPQEHEKYVQWMNTLAKRMKPYVDMELEHLLDKPQIITLPKHYTGHS